MPDWMFSTITALPAIIWVIAALGIPWALIVLPRRDWFDRPLVACLALAFGPALLTAWMLVLGLLGSDDNPDAGATRNPMQTLVVNHTGGVDMLQPLNILAGTLVIAIAGMILLIWKIRNTSAPENPALKNPLAFDERLLIGLIVVATVARWVITSWLPFGSWDPLWVYGYQARIYTLIGYIPADIGYYPQFLPLQYAYMQIVAAGGIDDHAARAVLPFLQVGSILAVYVLGSRLFNRRTGIIAAALWALYPHFGYWTRVGDLEIPVTFAFTGAAAFFLMAWFARADAFLRRRYALIAGLFFGVAMWTKPTAGAFALGVGLLAGVELLRLRFDFRAWWPRFEVALITAAACIPLGAVWYARNVLIGHAAVNFPPAFWLTQAMRSGAEFGWPLLALGVLLAYLYVGPVRARPSLHVGLAGAILLAAGLAPTIIVPARMDGIDWAFTIAGAAVFAVMLRRYARQHLTDEGRAILMRVGAGFALALPYFVTWFHSYSYHYRLSFAIVPLMLLPTAVILARWFTAERVAGWNLPRRAVYVVVLVAVSLPGVVVAVYDEVRGFDWLRDDAMSREMAQAGSLQGAVRTLQAYIDAGNEPPVVIAPGVQQLPFFFPLMEIRIVETPRSLNALPAHATHFIRSQEMLLAYAADGSGAPYQNQMLTSLPRENVARLAGTFSDPSFFYEVYELHVDDRFEPVPVETPADGEVIYGEFARYIGHTLDAASIDAGYVDLTMIWRGMGGAPRDYSIYVHLIHPDEPGDVLAGADGPIVPTRYGHYATLYWEADEYIIDRRRISLDGVALEPGREYRIRVGFYDLVSGERAPVQVDGAPAGDGYTLESALVAP